MKVEVNDGCLNLTVEHGDVLDRYTVYMGKPFKVVAAVTPEIIEKLETGQVRMCSVGYDTGRWPLLGSNRVERP